MEASACNGYTGGLLGPLGKQDPDDVFAMKAASTARLEKAHEILIDPRSTRRDRLTPPEPS